MDPQVTLRELLDGLAQGTIANRDMILDRIAALQNWIEKGGFLPKVRQWGSVVGVARDDFRGADNTSHDDVVLTDDDIEGLPEQESWHRVRLVNYQTLGARCGYGEGLTHGEAIEAALLEAKKTDPGAYYDSGADVVMFAGGINC